MRAVGQRVTEHGAHRPGAHLGLQVVGGHLGAWHHAPVFAGERLLVAAVEEERHVRVLLRLRRAQLRQPRRGNDVAHQVVHRLRAERHRKRERVVVLRHGDDLHQRPRPRVEPVEVGKRERAHGLAHAVAAEIEAHEGIAIDHGRQRATVRTRHDPRRHELVVHPRRIRALECGQCVRLHRGLATHRRVVPALRALPPVVAVHTIVATAHTGQLGLARNRGERLAQEPQRALRWGIASVEQGVQHHPRHLLPHRHLHQRIQVRLERMHPTVAQQAQEVQGAVIEAHMRARLKQRGVLEKAAGLDGAADAHEVLHHHAPRAQVEVPHFAVAHLAFGQPHRLPRCGQQRAGAVRPDAVPVGRVGEADRVRLTFFAVPPPI